MHYLIFPLGTRGDVNPLLRIGQRLKCMGHTVTVVSLDYFEEATREAGLDFEILTRDDFFQNLLLNPKLWHPTKGFELLMQTTMRLIPAVYNRIGESVKDGRTAVVAGPLALGARMAWDKWKFPLFTICLQPVIFGGVDKMPRFSGVPAIAKMPRIFRKMIYRVLDVVADYKCCPPINSFRRSAGIDSPIRHFLRWWLTPQPTLGLFPDWFGPPQPDWGANVELTGFPLEPSTGSAGSSQDIKPMQDSDVYGKVLEFLDQGEAPILCTFGSGMMHGEKKFQEVIRMCNQTGWRSILIGPDTDRFQSHLPGHVRAWRYVPFEWLLSRCRAVIHHGGIGTIAETIRAGKPQLIMPMTFDQPDNACRIRELNLGDSIWPRHFRMAAITKGLERILNSEVIAESCRFYSEKTNATDGVQMACDKLVAEPAGE